MRLGSPVRVEKRVFRFTAASAASMVLLVLLHELARSRRLLGLPWSAQAPQQLGPVMCLLLLLVIGLGLSSTNALFLEHDLVSPRLRRLMTGTFAYFGVLAAFTLSAQFFEPSAVRHWNHLLLGAWVLALGLAVYQISASLRVYRQLELHLDNERELSSQLFRHSTTDTLTGLPNRLLFNDRLARAVARAGRTQRPLAVLFINLDRFRHVNDLLGHDAGDGVLRAIAGRLLEGLRTADAVCRVAGDEFLAFASEFGDVAVDVPRLTERLCEQLARTVRIGGREISCTVSIGVSVFPYDGEDVTTLVKHAEQAMQSAKGRGRNSYSLYRPEMQRTADERVVLETQLRHALEAGELYLEYQPQVDASTGKVVGAEALVRWHHPERGALPPGYFIPVAEDSSLIVALDRWVLRTACAQLSVWRRAGFDTLRLSVNLSAKNFYRDDLPEAVGTTLSEHGVPGSALDLEITESTLMSEAPNAVEVLKRIRAMGISIGIDDFGTGYSSLGYLNRFPVDGLKIDRSLISDVWSSASAAAITSAVVAIGRSLNLRVVAEGVETEAQLQFLQKQGCDLVQGFLYSRPLAAQAFEGLLRGPLLYPLSDSHIRLRADVS